MHFISGFLFYMTSHFTVETVCVSEISSAGESHTIELLNPASVELVCTWAGSENKPPNVTGYWTKDGSEIKNSSVTVQLDNEQYVLKQM